MSSMKSLLLPWQRLQMDHGVVPQAREHEYLVYQIEEALFHICCIRLTYEAAAEIDSFITSFKFLLLS